MKTLILTAALLTLTLTACGADSSPPPIATSPDTDTPIYSHAPSGSYDEIYVFPVETRDGTATCIIWDGYKAGGLDCNFPSPTPETAP